MKEVDIARIHGVSKSSVSNALAALGAAGYLVYEKYKPVRLTEEGRKLALQTFGKHMLLVRFLVDILKIPRGNAEDAACKMEHAMGENLTLKLAEFVRGRLGAAS